MISQSIIDEFKEFEKIDYSSGDEHLGRLLERSYQAIQRQCGPFDINVDETGKELVFCRTRYAYQDLLEYFNENYREDIINFGISLMVLDGDINETI